MKAISTKYIGPTNHRGARIKATDHDGNFVTVSYTHELSTDGEHDRAALALLQKMGWPGRWVRGSFAGGRGNVYVCDAGGQSSQIEIVG